MNALTLDPRRTAVLMRNDVVASYRNLIIGFGAVCGAILVLYVLTTIGGGSEAFHVPVFTLFMLIGGYIVASLTFGDLHDDRKGVHYLTVPGSLWAQSCTSTARVTVRMSRFSDSIIRMVSMISSISRPMSQILCMNRKMRSCCTMI